MTISRNEAVKIAKAARENGMGLAESNVYIVQLIGVQLIEGPIPKDVRKALNDAVKDGRLGHIKRNGLKKEAYFHKNSRWVAMEKIEKDYKRRLETLRGVYVHMTEIDPL